MKKNIMCLIDIANDEKLLQPTISANTTTTETISENYLQAPIYANKLKTTLGRIVSSFISSHEQNKHNNNNNTTTKSETKQLNLQWSFRLFHSLKQLSPNDLRRTINNNVSSNNNNDNKTTNSDNVLNQNDHDNQYVYKQMIQNTCFHTSNLISLTNFENNLYEFLKHIKNNNNNASNSSFFENNSSNTSSNRKMVQRRHGLLCKILMDVLKPSEWVVNEDNNNNDENLYTFSNHDDDQDNDTFEHKCTNYIFLFTPYPTNMKQFKFLLNTPRSTSVSKATEGNKNSKMNYDDNDDNNNFEKQKQMVNHSIDAVHKLLQNSFEKMSIKLIWIDTTTTLSSLSVSNSGINDDHALNVGMQQLHRIRQESYLYRTGCMRLSKQLGFTGFTMNELLFKSKLISIDQMLQDHFFHTDNSDNTINNEYKNKNNMKKVRDTKHEYQISQPIFHGEMCLNNIANKKVDVDTRINVEVVTLGNCENATKKDRHSNSSTTTIMSNTLAHKFILENFTSYDRCMHMYQTNLITHICKPSIMNQRADNNIIDDATNIQNFQTLMLYLSTNKKCAVVSVYEMEEDNSTLGEEHLAEVENIFSDDNDDGIESSSSGDSELTAPTTTTITTTTTRTITDPIMQNDNRNEPKMKFAKLLMLKPMTPITALVSILPTYIDQLIDHKTLVSPELAGNVLPTSENMNTNKSNCVISSLSIDGFMCPPPSTLLNLNTYKDDDTDNNVYPLQNTVASKDSSIVVTRKHTRNNGSDNHHNSNDTDSSQMTMIISSSSSDMEDEDGMFSSSNVSNTQDVLTTDDDDGEEVGKKNDESDMNDQVQIELNVDAVGVVDESDTLNVENGQYNTAQTNDSKVNSHQYDIISDLIQEYGIVDSIPFKKGNDQKSHLNNDDDDVNEVSLSNSTTLDAVSTKVETNNTTTKTTATMNTFLNGNETHSTNTTTNSQMKEQLENKHKQEKLHNKQEKLVLSSPSTSPEKESEADRIANAFSAFKESCENLLTTNRKSIMRDLSKQILPTLYTKLGSKDGRNKYLPVVTCKQIRTFIKDQLLIGKTDLKKKYMAKKKPKPKVLSTPTASTTETNTALLRENKIYDYQIQIYLRMEVASLARIAEAASMDTPTAPTLKPRDPIKAKNLDDICSLLQSISFLMDANAKKSHLQNNNNRNHMNSTKNYNNTCNISISKFLDLFLVNDFKRILPLTLFELYDELNIELSPSLVALKSKLLLQNVHIDHSSSEGNNSNHNNNNNNYTPLNGNNNLEKALVTSPSIYHDINSNMSLSRTNSNSSTSSGNNNTTTMMPSDGTIDVKNKKNNNKNHIKGVTVNSSLDRAGGLVTERKALLNNFTQKLSNPKLLFRSVIVPKSKKTNRMPRKTGINKSNNNNNNKTLFGSKNNRRRNQRSRYTKHDNSTNSNSNVRNNVRKRKKASSGTTNINIVEETPERKKIKKKKTKKKQGGGNNSSIVGQDSSNNNGTDGSTTLVKRNSFRQLF